MKIFGKNDFYALEKSINSYIGELNRNNIINPLINLWRFVFSENNKLTLIITKVDRKAYHLPGKNCLTALPNSTIHKVRVQPKHWRIRSLRHRRYYRIKFILHSNWASGL
ncbi:hypothetical protein H8356DRAFT_1360641 [Neocallimastix lanati (nom. inval.)]|nr:hypothetical protein H8356DRAFT_1360641 [Neocallimastix sp. JGI-2020a]